MSKPKDKETLERYRETYKKKCEFLKSNDPQWVERQRQLRKQWRENHKTNNPNSFFKSRKLRTQRYRKKHIFKILCVKRCNNQITPWELWKLAKKQKLMCAITNDKLTRTNISLDHIIPISKGGTNTIENLRFVTLDVNYAKRTLNDLELLTLCTKIVKGLSSKINLSPQ